MGPTIPSSEPSSVRAGDTWRWDATYSDYPPSDGWALAYSIRGIGVLAWDAGWIDDDGSTYSVTIPAASTAALGAGDYEWVATATKGAEKYTAGYGLLRVLPNLATATAGQRQSHAEKMVPLIEAELERRITPAPQGGRGGAESYSVHGRQFTGIDTDKLTRMLGFYRSQIRARRQGTAGGLGTAVHVRFTRPR